jgi:hypothetical protein
MIRVPLLVATLLAAAAVNADSLTDQWALEVGRDATTYQDVATLRVDAVNDIADEYARKRVHPQLAFHCVVQGNTPLSVRLDWRRFISSFNTEIGFKADERELLLVNWGVDKSNKITLPRGAKDANDLVEYLRGAASLQVEVIPYSESLITVNFDISGIDAALKSIADECR